MHMNSVMQIPALRGSYLTISFEIIKGPSLTQAIGGFVCTRQGAWNQDIFSVMHGFSLFNTVLWWVFLCNEEKNLIPFLFLNTLMFYSHLCVNIYILSNDKCTRDKNN